MQPAAAQLELSARTVTRANSLSGKMEEKPGETKRRVGTLAKTACRACRNLKMRCVGADNPPCARCSKVGRYCVVSASSHRHRASVDIRTVQHHAESKSLVTGQAPTVDSNHAASQQVARHHVRHSSTPTLGGGSTTLSFMTTSTVPSAPSHGRWVSALSTICTLPPHLEFDSAVASLGHLQGRGDLGERPVSSRQSHERAYGTAHRLPSDDELCHLIHFFITELLVHIPILTELDVNDLAVMVKAKRPLAYSMAYVAARFVPGCKAIRSMLAPTILAMVRYQFDLYDRGDEERWTLLQALAVLYNWAPTQNSDVAADEGDFQIELRQEMLKASIEALALRYSLHRSAEKVAALLKRGVDNIHQTFAFRQYLYWLWLFSLAHFRSLISETPPSIREDATITWAPQLLESINNEACVRPILARVEMSLVWVRAGLRERGLGEWWCKIPTQIDLDSALALFRDLDAALQTWRRNWGLPGQQARFDGTPKPSRDDALDFCYNFTRFCVSTYVTKVLHSSASAESLSPSMVNLVLKSVERASTFCHSFLDLTPLAKSSMRFSPDTNFAMAASSCEFLIHVHNSSIDLDLVQSSHLSTVRRVAELMVDLGVDDRHSAKLYGHRILAKLQTMKSAELWQKSQRPSSQRSGHMGVTTTGPQGPPTSLHYAAAADDGWPMRGTPGQLELANGEQQGLALASGDGSGLWSHCAGAEAFVVDSFWPS